MVSIVLVSHSLDLSTAVKALADQQIHGRARIVAVGGSDNPHQPFGTDPVAIAEAIQSVHSEEGVLVLMDLGSAVLSGQVALDLLPPAQRVGVHLSVGPFVEGAMAAAVQASIGMSLAAVAREAEEATQAKTAVLHTGGAANAEPPAGPPSHERLDAALHTASADVIVVNPAGLHFGPAARFIQTAARFQAEVHVSDLTTGAGPAPASRFNQLLALGIEKDHCIRIEAVGQDADDAVNTLVKQVAHDIGGHAPSPAAAAAAPITGSGALLLTGQPASSGVAIGQAFVVTQHHDLLQEDDPAGVAIENDPVTEWARFGAAHHDALVQLDDLTAQIRQTLGVEQAVIFRAHALLLQDRDFLSEVRSAIQRGLTAEAALRRAGHHWADR